ncbi:MAG: WD40-repeat-containing domain protein [Benjaminiella poitrasii]|nr:MAG: WD40-repeat-containing domain protein [Benjaminiella poitrasii]
MSESMSDIDIEGQEDKITSPPDTVQIVLSKETRKLRKKKQFLSDDDYPASPKKTPTNTNKKVASKVVPTSPESPPEKENITITPQHDAEQQETFVETSIKTPHKKRLSDFLLMSKEKTENDSDMDEVDTDDLLNELEQLPRLRKTLTSQKKKKTKRASSSSYAKPSLVKKQQIPRYDPKLVSQLSHEYPDSYWQFYADRYAMMDAINAHNPVKALPFDMSDQGAITSMTLSADGTLLATFSNVGAIKIWDVMDDFQLLRKIRDHVEPQIDEFYCGQFLEGGLLVSGGKLKDRHRWSAEDGDNHILPCPLKIFRIETCERVTVLEGHMEEILCIKAVNFKGQRYLISTSQDGYIIKWHMNEDWTELLDSVRMRDGLTCMAFTISFVPNTGNKYFIAACDEHLRLYDFENAVLLQTFEDIYSSYCDCGKFIHWVDDDQQETSVIDEMEKRVEELSVVENEEGKQSNDSKTTDEEAASFAWFISRGAEMCDVSDGVSSKPNTCTLHKLIYPTEVGGQFKLETVKKYMHEDYHSNSWLVKITSNGRYILAPTIYGQIFVFNIASGKVTAVIKEHEDIEVRDVIFHPYKPLLFSCGDDGYVKVYTYDDDNGNDKNSDENDDDEEEAMSL